MRAFSSPWRSRGRTPCWPRSNGSIDSTSGRPGDRVTVVSTDTGPLVVGATGLYLMPAIDPNRPERSINCANEPGSHFLGAFEQVGSTARLLFDVPAVTPGAYEVRMDVPSASLRAGASGRSRCSPPCRRRIGAPQRRRRGRQCRSPSSSARSLGAACWCGSAHAYEVTLAHAERQRGHPMRALPRPVSLPSRGEHGTHPDRRRRLGSPPRGSIARRRCSARTRAWTAGRCETDRCQVTRDGPRTIPLSRPQSRGREAQRGYALYRGTTREGIRTDRPGPACEPGRAARSGAAARRRRRPRWGRAEAPAALAAFAVGTRGKIVLTVE